MFRTEDVRNVSQPWIRSSRFDSTFILLPAFLSVLWIIFWQSKHPGTDQVSTLGWVVLVVGIDVSHVYSTLYRTYLDPIEFKQRSTLYTMAPLVGWAFAAMLYSIGAMIFWRVLAYLAVFHFIRQQYGFMRIYCRKETRTTRWAQNLDLCAIYMATLYPLIYWHCHIPRNFHWFIDGDFVRINSQWFLHLGFLLFLVTMTAYVFKEVVTWVKIRYFNVPKNLIVTGTALSWYLGIIYYNGDLAFTVTNVVSHGIPYIALIWIYGRLKIEAGSGKSSRTSSFSWRIYSLKAVPIFFGTLLIASFLEEGLWDGLIWRDHLKVFAVFSKLPQLHDETLLAWIVPLLALPQITHYILDGFIWKLDRGANPWRSVAFQEGVDQ